MNEKSWNQLGIAAVVLMGIMVLLNFAFPVPNLKKLSAQTAGARDKLEKQITDDRVAVGATKVKNDQRLWSKPADQVAAAAMAKVNEVATAQQLKVVSFRPQRPQDDEGVTRLPFQVSLEGYFPKVIAFVHAMETSKFKLPVVTVQIASADGATDKVSATVGIVAFRELETKKP